MDFPHENVSPRQADDNIANVEIMDDNQTDTTEPSSTNLLLSLPPELLLPIFSFVGVENFRHDVRRLAVSKKFYAYARPILIGHLRLYSPNALIRMLRATRRGPSLESAQQMTKSIDVTIENWTSSLELERLASRLRVFAALRTLVIRSGGRSRFSRRLPSRVFSRFAAIHHLTSLEIDLADVRLQKVGVHICDSISQRIPTLKRLRCRLPYICTDLLETPPGDLEELIISLASPGTYFYPRQCSTGFDLREAEHRAALETRLVQFATSMCEPKIVRLVHHFWSCYTAYAFDAIRKRRFFLGKSAAWDADGVLLPEDWEENEESQDGEESYEWESDELTEEDWEDNEESDELTEEDWEEDEESDEWTEEDDELLEAEIHGDDWLSE